MTRVSIRITTIPDPGALDLQERGRARVFVEAKTL
jgi:hypothetical protein